MFHFIFFHFRGLNLKKWEGVSVYARNPMAMSRSTWRLLYGRLTLFCIVKPVALIVTLSSVGQHSHFKVHTINHVNSFNHFYSGKKFKELNVFWQNDEHTFLISLFPQAGWQVCRHWTTIPKVVFQSRTNYFRLF